MNRKEFLKMCAILGIGIPAQAGLSGCGKEDPTKATFNGKVVIVGAGPGGMAAGYLLHQYGIDFEILEASSQVGGRIKINTGFADFPIPLGAEWIESEVSVLSQIVNDSSVDVNVKTVADKPDFKFVNSSWFGFFETYILPSIKDKIKFNEVVTSVDYSSEKVNVSTSTSNFQADKVIVSVPLKVLQDGDIEFTPSLPQAKATAIKKVEVWEGFKAFFEFGEAFYGEGHEFAINPKTDGEKIYYNAAYGQQSSKNILGLFVVGKPAQQFISKSDEDVKKMVLAELDGLFNNKATTNYIKHMVQDWNNEPYIKGGYLSDYADWKTVRTLGEAIENKVFFAGGAYTDGEDWVSVHVAAKSAKTAVETIKELT